MLLISDVFVLINYYGQILWFSTAACIAGMLWLRHKQPNLPRPIRVNTIIPIVFLACCVFLILFPIPTQPWNTVIGIVITLTGKFCIFWRIIVGENRILRNVFQPKNYSENVEYLLWLPLFSQLTC